jgi:hypothetical protein
MKTMPISVAAVALYAAGTAFAQGADKKPPAASTPPAGAAAAKPAPEPPKGEAMMAPKPAPELDQLKDLVGNWKCDGKMGINGKEQPMKSTTYKAAWEMNNFWVVGHIDRAKTKDAPAYHGVDYYTFDPATKMLVMTSFDNMGAWGTSTSKGFEGDKQEWSGKVHMMGAELDSKSTLTKKSDKEIHITGTTSGSGLTMTMDQTCKK